MECSHIRLFFSFFKNLFVCSQGDIYAVETQVSIAKSVSFAYASKKVVEVLKDSKRDYSFNIFLIVYHPFLYIFGAASVLHTQRIRLRTRKGSENPVLRVHVLS